LGRLFLRHEPRDSKMLADAGIKLAVSGSGSGSYTLIDVDFDVVGCAVQALDGVNGSLWPHR
jgi:hypothetical protein